MILDILKFIGDSLTGDGTENSKRRGILAQQLADYEAAEAAKKDTTDEDLDYIQDAIEEASRDELTPDDLDSEQVVSSRGKKNVTGTTKKADDKPPKKDDDKPPKKDDKPPKKADDKPPKKDAKPLRNLPKKDDKPPKKADDKPPKKDDNLNRRRVDIEQKAATIGNIGRVAGFILDSLTPNTSTGKYRDQAIQRVREGRTLGGLVERLTADSRRNLAAKALDTYTASRQKQAEDYIEELRNSGMLDWQKYQLMEQEKRSMAADIRSERLRLGLEKLHSEVPSDARIKNTESDGDFVVKLLRTGYKLSDEDMKEIEGVAPEEVAKAILKAGRPYKGYELEFLDDLLGDDNKYKFDVKDSANWQDDVLNGYMKHIRNFHYTYKPEATQIDSNIDPNEEHIGPMAQDIEKVNPACIKETAEGVKTVDTGRLALMNAGAIAELAREIASLKEVI